MFRASTEDRILCFLTLCVMRYRRYRDCAWLFIDVMPKQGVTDTNDRRRSDREGHPSGRINLMGTNSSPIRRRDDGGSKPLRPHRFAAARSVRWLERRAVARGALAEQAREASAPGLVRRPSA